MRAALAETGLPLLGLNTRRGAAGMNGLAAVPGHGAKARAAVDEAIDYANAVNARHIHVMAGNAAGEAARAAFLATLRHACAQTNRMIVIEPLNAQDAPGYFLRTTAQAADIIAEVGAPNLKLMFDCYHVARIEGDVTGRLAALWPVIGHIQVASVPDRGAPDHGTLDYAAVWQAIRANGWSVPVGAEYRVTGRTEDTLGWRASAG